MNIDSIPPARQPIEAEREAVPRSKEDAAATFYCNSHRCTLSGQDCGARCRASQLAPLRGAGATICAACPAGRARMRLLGLGRSVERAEVDAARQSVGHNAADGACARCLLRPATGQAHLYSAFCSVCINEGRRAHHSPVAWAGKAKAKAHAILAWLRTTQPTAAEPKPAPAKKAKPQGQPRLIGRAHPPCAECHKPRSVVRQAVVDEGLGHLCGGCAAEARKARKWVVSDAKCARCSMPCGKRLKTRGNPDLCSGCHRAEMDAVRSSIRQRAKRKAVAA